jgi:uncharacterized membrane protein
MKEATKRSILHWLHLSAGAAAADQGIAAMQNINVDVLNRSQCLIAKASHTFQVACI